MFRAALICKILLLLTTAPLASAIEDPTRPPRAVAPVKAAAQPARVPQLQSILTGRKRRLAMIDNQVLAKGQRAGNVQLLRINDDHVIVRIGRGEQMTLRLGSNKIHKETK